MNTAVPWYHYRDMAEHKSCAAPDAITKMLDAKYTNSCQGQTLRSRKIIAE